MVFTGPNIFSGGGPGCLGMRFSVGFSPKAQPPSQRASPKMEAASRLGERGVPAMEALRHRMAFPSILLKFKSHIASLRCSQKGQI